jgi:2-methylaconitate isomerase
MADAARADHPAGVHRAKEAIVQTRVPAVFMRGGTSRAIVFHERDLAPYSEAERTAIVLAAMGSPDPYGRQVDGLGGGISSLSKIAIVGVAPPDADADVTFTFGQVEVSQPRIDWIGTCGNISAAVPVFAVEEGLVPATEPIAPVRVLNTNTGKRYVARIPVRDGAPETEGDYAIDGVPGTAARIALEFLAPGGSLGGGVLPTGAPREELTLANGRQVEVSLVDAANPMVYVQAASLGATATEAPEAVDADAALLGALEEIRNWAAVRLGMARDLRDAAERVRATPKVAMVAAPHDYRSTGGEAVAAGAVDLVGRMVSMSKTHRTFALTGAICTAVAAALPGTVVHDVVAAHDPAVLRIGHPAGILEVGTRLRAVGDGWEIESVTTYRTARRIMEGYVRVPAHVLARAPSLV